MADYNKLLEKTRSKMAEEGIDAIVLFPSSSQYYLTGFKTFPGERLLLTIIPIKDKPFFIAPKLYEGQVKKESWIEEVITWTDEENPYALLRDIIEKRGLANGRIAVDDSMYAKQLLGIMEQLPEVEFIPMRDVVDGFRLIKSIDEIEKIRNASKIVDEIADAMRSSIKVGMTEIEIAAMMEFEMRKRGSEGPSFETIVGSGPNSALPHYNAGERKISKGDFIVMDFGATYKGYCSDTTRTFCVGEPTEKMIEVYNVVKEAQEIGVRAVKPGIKAKEVDEAVRRYITEKGYGQYFTHRTGHGLGLEVHEEPYISAISETILEPGMVFSIEPGIYLEGQFGVRIEDIVYVTEDGCERLNNFTRELTLITD